MTGRRPVAVTRACRDDARASIFDETSKKVGGVLRDGRDDRVDHVETVVNVDSATGSDDAEDRDERCSGTVGESSAGIEDREAGEC
ncbi:hypothetical protein A6048_05250 [Dietzia psychralcaliphila]|uniref:Uncharacterized protein n=1 Tax=Dietzia psychralcaliphila TaxID=139021 RepID=A0AAD0JPZ8_9ACTN|nr:hypothetical protein A6048_05250 [Dietzia psychralcaliphila]